MAGREGVLGVSCSCCPAGVFSSLFPCRVSPTPSFLCLSHTQGIELGHVGIVSTNEIFVPAYNSPVRVLSVFFFSHSAPSPGMRRPTFLLLPSSPPVAPDGPAPLFGQPLGRAGGPGADGRARDPRQVWQDLPHVPRELPCLHDPPTRPLPLQGTHTRKAGRAGGKRWRRGG